MNPFSAFAFRATDPSGAGNTVPRTMPDRLSDCINILDYGADPTGTVGSGAAIQAALDTAYGPLGNTHAQNSNFYADKAVIFPRGTYLIDQQLLIGQAQSVCLLGDGQHATKLVYTGPDSRLQPNGDNNPVGSGTDPWTPLLYIGRSLGGRFRGISFDVTSSNAIVAVQWGYHRGLAPSGNAGGTGNSWIDCAFRGGQVGLGLYPDANGDEQSYVVCSFENNTSFGHFSRTQNDLCYLFQTCKFVNNNRGIDSTQGGSYTIRGCSFYSSADYDIVLLEAPTCVDLVEGCYSESTNFCNMLGNVVSCYHNAASNGVFWTPDSVASPGPLASTILEANWSVKGELSNVSGNNGLYPTSVCLTGNRFDRSGYINNFAGHVVENI